MSGNIANFITVKRILNDKDTEGAVKKNGKIREETININYIRGARAWHKSKEDELNVDGPMTMLTIQSDSKDKVMTIMINESNESFNSRLAQQTMVI